MAKRKRDEFRNEFTARVYLAAAEERLASLEFLYARGLYTLALYVSGVAVESIFRAYRCRIDPVFDARHNLYDLARSAKFVQIVPPGRTDEYDKALIDVAVRWSNNHRYRSDAAVRSFLRRAELNRKVKGDFLKENARRAIDAAFFLVNLGLLKWKS